jgi:hypothetical protein
MKNPDCKILAIISLFKERIDSRESRRMKTREEETKSREA